MILVFPASLGLPGLAVRCHGDVVFAGGGGGVAAEMPASKGEGAGHDGEERLFKRSLLAMSQLSGMLRWFERTHVELGILFSGFAEDIAVFLCFLLGFSAAAFRVGAALDLEPDARGRGMGKFGRCSAG